MVKLLRYSLWLIALFPLMVFAATANNNTGFVEGKDYKIVQSATAPASPLPKDKIQVIEFFNYGCPACNHFEPALEKWLANGKPKDVAFERVPVVFHPEWDILARAYYVAKDLGVESKITPAIFNAIHQQGDDLSTPAALAKFFAQHGVKEQDFNSALQFSPGIDAQMMRGENLMGVYQVFQIPTLLINGKYQTNLGMADGDGNRMIQIADYLIAKARMDMKIKKVA